RRHRPCQSPRRALGPRVRAARFAGRAHLSEVGVRPLDRSSPEASAVSCWRRKSDASRRATASIGKRAGRYFSRCTDEARLPSSFAPPLETLAGFRVRKLGKLVSDPESFFAALSKGSTRAGDRAHSSPSGCTPRIAKVGDVQVSAFPVARRWAFV